MAYREPEARDRTPGRVRRPAGLIVVTVALATGVGLLVTLVIRGSPRTAAPTDVAVLPFDIEGDTTGTRGRDLANLTRQRLQGTPGLRVAALSPSVPVQSPPRPESTDLDALLRTLRVRHLVRGTVRPTPPGADVMLEVVDSLRRSSTLQRTIHTSGAGLFELSDSIAREIVRVVLPPR